MSYSDIFSHIVAYLEPCVTLAYSEPCHIQNPSIFKTWDAFRTSSRHIPAYSECCVTLVYWKPYHIQHFAIFHNFRICRTRGIFRILNHTGIFNNGSYNNSNILFFTLTLYTFQQKMLFWLQWHPLQCSVFLNNMPSLKIT